mmetsp:Transcript_34924/g.72736  ORF Transcript_34924/g.72736 Transcript_34924/m.72736 type:complete len:114 (-) Transcript_34924:1263-1604(-)
MTIQTTSLGQCENEERLMRNVKICPKISHPNVVRVHDFGKFPSGIFISMEILGPGLEQVLADETPVPVVQAKDLLEGVAGALSEEIIHRDLKPSNVVLLDDRDKVLFDSRRQY